MRRVAPRPLGDVGQRAHAVELGEVEEVDEGGPAGGRDRHRAAAPRRSTRSPRAGRARRCSLVQGASGKPASYLALASRAMIEFLSRPFRFCCCSSALLLGRYPGCRSRDATRRADCLAGSLTRHSGEQLAPAAARRPPTLPRAVSCSPSASRPAHRLPDRCLSSPADAFALPRRAANRVTRCPRHQEGASMTRTPVGLQFSPWSESRPRPWSDDDSSTSDTDSGTTSTKRRPPGSSKKPSSRRSSSATANRSAACRSSNTTPAKRSASGSAPTSGRRGPRPRLRHREGGPAGRLRHASPSRPTSKGSSRSSCTGSEEPDRGAARQPVSLLPFAHALVARQDLPIPAWLFAWGASIVLIVSFFALSVGWREPRFERDRWRPLGAGLSRALLGLPAQILCGAIGVFLLGSGDLRRPARHRSARSQLRPHLPLRHRLARLPPVQRPPRRRLPALQPLAGGRPRRGRRLHGARRSAAGPPRLSGAARALARRDRPGRGRLAGDRLRRQRRRRRRPLAARRPPSRPSSTPPTR